jgi:hypothetical protein
LCFETNLSLALLKQSPEIYSLKENKKSENFSLNPSLNPLEVKKLLVVGGFLLAFATATFAQDGTNYWARLNKNHPEAAVETILNPTVAPTETETTAGYRLNMVYDGQFRKLTSANLGLMQRLGLKKNELKDYKYELLFKYNNQEFWLPVQTDLMEELQLEVRQNEPVMLYTTLLQNPEEDKTAQKTLLVEEFRVN